MVSSIEQARSVPAAAGLRPAAVAGTALAILAVLVVLDLVAIFLTDGGTGPGQRVGQLLLPGPRNRTSQTLSNYSLLIGIAALLALLAARAFNEGSRWRRHWAGLVVIFLVLAYDEASSLHERLVPIIRQVVEAKGFLYFGWIIPGAIFALVIGLVYLRFVLALPRATAVLTILGGALYVTGTLGVEAISGAYASAHHTDTAGYLLITTVEESLDMLGLITFGYGLLRLLAGADGRLRLAGGWQGM